MCPKSIQGLCYFYHCSIIWIVKYEDDRRKYPISNNIIHLVRRLTYLGPSVGVEAGKRNKATSLDHGLRGRAHCRRAHRRLRAAVAQVVLVVCKLLLVSHNYCLGIYSILNLLYAKWTELCKV